MRTLPVVFLVVATRFFWQSARRVGPSTLCVWDVIGGTAEGGEAPADALVRRAPGRDRSQGAGF